MFLSLVLMYTGLEQQVFMDTLTQSQLPSLPVELVRSSSLAGGLVEWLLGDGVLLSPDPSASIRLHPLAIAGFVGLLANALSLLPIGSKCKFLILLLYMVWNTSCLLLHHLTHHSSRGLFSFSFLFRY